MSACPEYTLIDFHDISGHGISPAYGLEVMASKGDTSKMPSINIQEPRNFKSEWKVLFTKPKRRDMNEKNKCQTIIIPSPNH